MNEAQAGRGERVIAGLTLSAERRRLRGPGGEVALEPLVVQLLLMLGEAEGEVVARRAIFDRLWGAAQVGDDSLNRAAASLRRALQEASGGAVGLETVPRTGYRLTGSVEQAAAEPGWSRRATIGGIAAATAAVGGAAWWRLGQRADGRLEALLAQGEDILRIGLPSARDDATKLFEQAAAMQPDNPRALGLLAYARAYAAITLPPDDAGAAALQADRAIRAALAVKPDQPDAHLALLLLRGSSLDWISTDQKLRALLAMEPDNARVMSWLVALLQAAGMGRESWDLNERLVRLHPLSPASLYRRALKLWIFGRVAEADRVIDPLMQLWPAHPWVWNARFIIFAFTGRAPAAWAMMEDEAHRPATITPSLLRQWEPTLKALDDPVPAKLSAARESNLAAARNSPGQSAYAIMSLAALNQVDAAFDVAGGFLLSRGSVITRRPPKSQGLLVSSPGWRRTQWLFTPATASMRSDPRFLPLCRDIGLVDYWNARRVRPDLLHA